MKFISIWKPDPRTRSGDPPTQKQMEEMGRLVGELMGAGILLDTGGIMSDGTSLRVRRAGSKVTVTDGPFVETKEVIGGFAVFSVKSKDEVVAAARRFVECAGDGEAEIHEVSELE
jgi:hypothetical protein